MVDEVDILLVEDMESDIELIKEALREAGGAHRIEVATDGESAVNLLKTRERPHLIILDLNLPGMSGFEVLKTLKRDPQWKAVPIIILTNSKSQEDVVKCHGQHANAYIRKPVGYDKLVQAVKDIWQFWVHTAILPVPGVQVSHTVPPSRKRISKKKG